MHICTVAMDSFHGNESVSPDTLAPLISPPLSLFCLRHIPNFARHFFCSKKLSKCDLCAAVWQQYLSSFVVFLKIAQEFAERHGIPFMEVSAFTGMNVHNLFSKIGTFTLSVLMNMCYWPNVMSRWLDIGQVLFVSVNRNTQRKPTSSSGKAPWRRGWQNAWPTFIHLDRSSLVNKGYIIWRKAEPTREIRSRRVG